MTSPGAGSRLPAATLGRIARLVLAIVAILSMCALFMQVWGPLADAVNAHKHEKSGVEYLIALNKLTTTLVDAESSAVAGDAVSRGALSSAADSVTAVDAKVGGELGSKERWATLSTKIDALSDRTPATASAAYTAYSGVTDLVLALYSRVRVQSGLDRDPDAVVFYLQDGATQELPEIIVRAGRYNDLAVMADQLPGPAVQTSAVEQARVSAAATLASLRFQISEGASDLNDDLEAAVDTSENGTLGTTVLQQLDGFQRSTDVIAPPPALAGNALANPVEVGKERDELESAAISLMGTMMDSLDKAVTKQDNDARSDRTRAVGWFVLALFLLVAAYVAGRLIRVGKRGRKTDGDAGQGEVSAGQAGSAEWQPSLPAQPASAFADAGSRSVDEYGETHAPRREWSGAPR